MLQQNMRRRIAPLPFVANTCIPLESRRTRLVQPWKVRTIINFESQDLILSSFLSLLSMPTEWLLR